MEEIGIIQKSSSPYSSPAVVVKKKDGGNRICVDLRHLNKVTTIDPQAVPSPADSFFGMKEDRYISKRDLTKGYHQIRVRPTDVHKTAFVTMGQHYEYLRMPFGMVNSGMTMMRAVWKLLDVMDNVVDYIDDLLVHTQTWEEHVQTLKELFKRLKAANLVARPTKCAFGATQVDFLGHCLEQGMIGLQDVNVQKMRDAPRPTTKKEIRSFLGLAGYCQDFIPNFAAIAAPLSDLTHKAVSPYVRVHVRSTCLHALRKVCVTCVEISLYCVYRCCIDLPSQTLVRPQEQMFLLFSQHLCGPDVWHRNFRALPAQFYQLF